ncbi:SDR family NAD(P)-dependent oxidoreductase [Nostoc sp.]|uniref:SDR family NAD(P)-dependent oxidoreductase n=1 Tax=Nostoc sp. TaxID=1180 RepID=UPI002FF76E01
MSSNSLNSQNMKLEVVVLPVSNVDQAKDFYKTLGWRLDADFVTGEDFRVVQLTPPGSEASIIFGSGVTLAAPGSVQGLYLIVYDIEAARAELAQVEERLRIDTRIGILINNAGVSTASSFADQSPDEVAKIINLNITAVTRLTSAVAPRFAKTGDGTIINISSVVGLAPEFGMTIYGATKAFVLFLTQGLHLELGPKGVYVQAVLPASTRTEIWERAGWDMNAVPPTMEVDELVDAALVGFDRRETVTMPSLPDANQWKTFDAARQSMIPNFNQVNAAARYHLVS